MFSIIAILLVVLSCSVVMTGLMRRYAISKRMLDVPNTRSSHHTPTPRGGGVAIVVSFYIGICLAWANGALDNEVTWGIIGAGGVVAAVGFLDDVGNVSPLRRLMVHFIAALWIAFCMDWFPVAILTSYGLHSALFIFFIVLLSLVWVLNIFNFMDGIDGIASSEAIFIAVSGAFFTGVNGDLGVSLTFAMLAVATIGFLLWNWPPAKIFMGDVGSGFLGIVLASLAFVEITQGRVPLFSWLILFGVFLVDATFTLSIRILNKNKWAEAHCSHTYQKTASIYGHKKTTLMINLINFFWLLPLASYALNKPSHIGFVIMVLAFLPLLTLAIRFGAGKMS